MLPVSWGREKRGQEALGDTVSGGGFRTDVIAMLLIKHQIKGIRIELMSQKS